MGCNLFGYCSAIFLILGAIMLSVASTLSRVFYHSRTMAIGIILCGSGNGASANRSKELACNFHVSLGTFLFRYLPALLLSILMEMGISKDKHYPIFSASKTSSSAANEATVNREQLGSDVVFSEATLRRRISDNLDASSSNSTFDDTSIVLQRSSAMTMAYSNSSTEGPIKSFVFSQWTRMLDLVEISLNQYCIQLGGLTGQLL